MTATIKSAQKAATHLPSSSTQPVARQSSQSVFRSATIPEISGNLAVQRLLRAGAIQAQLTVSRPEDPDEREADHVADQVMRGVEPRLVGSAASKIQRKCGACAAGPSNCP